MEFCVMKKLSIKNVKKDLIDPKRIDSLFIRVSEHIDQARQGIQRTIDIEMVKAYWLMGQDIVEEEQYGKHRAEYGKTVLKSLSTKLQNKYIRGFGVDTLEQARKFYLIYQVDSSNKKSDALRRNSQIPAFNLRLSWTHYRALMRIKRPEARRFYEIEASSNNCDATWDEC